MQNRITQLRKILTQRNISNILVSNPKNIYYLTGVKVSQYHREAFVYVNHEVCVLFHSPLLHIPQTKNTSVEVVALDKKDTLFTYLQELKEKSIWIESDNLTVQEWDKLDSKMEVPIKHVVSVVEDVRKIKDVEEIRKMSLSGEITNKTWQQIKPKIVPGTSEIEIQNLINRTLLENGASSLPVDFPPIVASGKNSAYPHHISSDKKITSSDVVLVDFGCMVDEYYSDMSRTISLGKNKKFEKIKQVIQAAYQAGAQAMRTGQNNQQIDQVVKKIIDDSEYAKLMIHSTGHGVGLAIHEAPSISMYSEKINIEKNMVITIEPGVYLPGEFGYRYENTILVTENEGISLT